MRVHKQPAFILLNRPYTESSWIVEVFSRDYGRLSLMAKGARRLKSKLKGVLLPFQPLIVSWSGKGEIPTLTMAEVDNVLFDLQADSRICGFYCNELLVHFLHRYDPHPNLFKTYQQTIRQLAANQDTPHSGITLRDFERSLIKEVGYEINFQKEADSGKEIEENIYYRYQQGKGFVVTQANHPLAVSGAEIKTLRRSSTNQFESNKHESQASKEIMRVIINQLLGKKKVYSRELFFPKSR